MEDIKLNRIEKESHLKKSVIYKLWWFFPYIIKKTNLVVDDKKTWKHLTFYQIWSFSSLLE